jgi:hypothetical protein
MAAGTVIRTHPVRVSVSFPYRATARVVALAMFLCGFALWSAVPAAVLFALPRLVHRGVSLPVVLVAVIAAMLAVTKVVALLNALYCRLMAVPPRGPAPPGWRRSACEPAAVRNSSVLETTVAASAIAAVVALVVWFLFFAHCAQGLCSA